MLNKMKSAFGGSKKLWAAIGTAALLVSAAIPALAADTAGVTATVTPQIVAIDVTDGSVAYGTVAFGGTNATFGGTAAEQQTISRSTSNVDINVTLKSSDAIDQTGPLQDWNLIACATPPGANQFGHQYDLEVGAGPAVWADFPDTNNYSGTVSTLTNANTSDTLDLKICMPASGDTSQHDTTVTALATAI